MNGRLVILATEEHRARALQVVRETPLEWWIRCHPPKRTLAQNAAQWPILTAFANQLPWLVNGEKVRMSEEEWKDVLTSGFKREDIRLAMGLDGRTMVMLGVRTSEMPKPVFSAYLDFLHAEASARNVNIDRSAA